MTEGKTVAAIIVAAGTSQRMGFDKLFHPLNGVEVLRRTLMAFDAHPAIDSLVVVAGENKTRVEGLLAAWPPAKPLAIVAGGSTRAASVAAGLRAAQSADVVAIHDGARPFVSQALITATVQAAIANGAAAPALPVHDTTKREADGFVAETVPRDHLVAIQTPQVFLRAPFEAAFADIPETDYSALTDDCLVMERAGKPVKLVPGEEANRKITTPKDLPDEAAPALRVGSGYDVHKLVEGRRLILGGVDIPYEKGLLGHSDADVLLHAVSDALLGAAALGDIGAHFPPTDNAFKDADSLKLLGKVARLIEAEGYQPVNIDATVICQAPKLAQHIPAMRGNIAGALGLPLQSVSVKATTEEGLGFTGQGLGIAAQCAVLLRSV